MATAFVWDNTSNAWASDHWGRSGVDPKWPGDTGSTTADTVEIVCATPPTTYPGVSLTIFSFECAGNDYTAASLVIATGGSLLMGTPEGSDAPTWSSSNATNAASADFYGESVNTTSVGDNASFNDNSTCVGDFGDFVFFNSPAVHSGYGTGSTYYLGAAIEFDPFTIFDCTPPVEFVIRRTGGSLVQTGSNPIVDGSSTPIAFNVSVDDTDIEVGNIKTGKTILGVDGELVAGGGIVAAGVGRFGVQEC